MGGSAVAKQELKSLREQLLKKEIDPLTTFVRGILSIIDGMDITNEDLQGVTPLLLNFVNRLIQNMEKRGA